MADDTFLSGGDLPSNENRSGPKRSSVLPWTLVFVSLGLLGAGIYFGRQLLEDEKARTAAAQKASDEAASKLTELEENKRALEARVEALHNEKTDLAEERNALSNEVREKESELEKLKATYDNLEDKMKAEIKKGEIRLSQANGRIRVDMVDKILFDSGEAELTARGGEVLGRLGAILANVEDKQIQVSGHTDDAPIKAEDLKKQFPTNWELSVARAVNVVRHLNEQGKVPAKRLVAAGYGQFHPVSSNANATGRAKNRRIEILLTPELERAAKPVQHAVAKEEKKPQVKVAATKSSAKTTAKKK